MAQRRDSAPLFLCPSVRINWNDSIWMNSLINFDLFERPASWRCNERCAIACPLLSASRRERLPTVTQTERNTLTDAFPEMYIPTQTYRTQSTHARNAMGKCPCKVYKEGKAKVITTITYWYCASHFDISSRGMHVHSGHRMTVSTSSGDKYEACRRKPEHHTHTNAHFVHPRGFVECWYCFV